MPVERKSSVILDQVALRLGSADFHFDGRIAEGAITAIAGPSGSGKSTLLALIAGFEQPDEGRVLIGGEDVSGLAPANRPVSLVFQDNNLFAHLDLFTNVGLGIDPAFRLTPADRQAVSQALTRVGLGGYEKRLPATLSGGERQRAAFARALVRRKPVMLLDEPFAALDPGLRSAMADLLLDLHRESGQTIVIVSHDPQEVERLASDVLFLEKGRILLAASCADFSRRRDIASVVEFLGTPGSGQVCT
ncbi:MULTISPECIES: thiamine ABC transporter ATP-binding protein [Alphaproteobacteria]|uniref:Thiamine import ATP-binding protein ThiQ n=2 Tax=Alphaproteobacteria TaxID=28211 RepID=A0A512HK92_9HYPH|nr:MULTISPECIES: ATP-binding cassette domain-containing protein [Alphaproteobacteria]GEO85830.1 thiamine import ATP-binding protein ThiQ [Ciceribacter naphthalenivorans]GLR21686.1 thiamine import ATP-binding protein ThiQ [Ciceribacter naphthalenivorans]GLT04542.1 thiamine import ATP-binding protein ThiQ [Sphingomonas psychrolutea]